MILIYNLASSNFTINLHLVGNSADQVLGVSKTIVANNEVTSPEFSKQQFLSKSHNSLTKTSKVLEIKNQSEKRFDLITLNHAKM